MARKSATSTVTMAFEETELRIAIADIQPLKLVSDGAKDTCKYAQIAASIREVGIVEPPVVVRDRGEPGKFLLLDGHLRIEVLKNMGETDVVCLVSTDDEAFTYNKHVNRIAPIQEHRMILKRPSEASRRNVLQRPLTSMSRASGESGISWTEFAQRLRKSSRISTLPSQPSRNSKR